MKKALLFCFGLLLLAAAQLQAAPANVNFTSERGIPFNLRFDGRILTRGGARQVHLNRIAPGMHWAEFAIPTGYGRSINYRTRVFLDPGLETTYVLLTRPGRAPELRKVAAVPLRGGYSRGGYSSGYPTGNPRGGQGDYRNGNEEYYDQDNYGNQPAANPNDGDYYPGSGVSYNSTMSRQDVDGLLLAVHRQSFDKDKLAMSQQALSETTILADDLTRLMRELTFEDARLELAKYGSARVADRQNLYRLNNGFIFPSSASKLQEYLAQSQQP